MKSEYSTKLLKRKTVVGTKWICKTKKGQYSNNRRLGVYVQMIKWPLGFRGLMYMFYTRIKQENLDFSCVKIIYWPI